MGLSDSLCDAKDLLKPYVTDDFYDSDTKHKVQHILLVMDAILRDLLTPEVTCTECGTAGRLSEFATLSPPWTPEGLSCLWMCASCYKRMFYQRRAAGQNLADGE
jgi:hypothetical protein